MEQHQSKSVEGLESKRSGSGDVERKKQRIATRPEGKRFGDVPTLMGSLPRGARGDIRAKREVGAK